MLFAGIDPGAAGGLGVINEDGQHIFSVCFKGMTEEEIHSHISEWLAHKSLKHVMLEHVHSMPGQGVASTFKFGASFGLMRGFLIASGASWGLVRPVKWQTDMNCLSGGDKSIPMAAAQKRWPDVKMNKTGKHQVYDALLIAEHCRRCLIYTQEQIDEAKIKGAELVREIFGDVNANP